MSAREGFFIDLSNYKESRSDRIAEGSYLVRITDAQAGETKKGDPKVTLWYNVVGGPFADATLIDTLTLTEKAAFRTVNVLRSVGVKVEKRNMNIPFKQLIGRTLVVTVKDGEEYNDEIKSEVRSYAPAATWKGYDNEVAPAKAPEAEEPYGDEDPTGLEATETTSSTPDTDDNEVSVPDDGSVSL